MFIPVEHGRDSSATTGSSRIVSARMGLDSTIRGGDQVLKGSEYKNGPGQHHFE